MCVSLQLNETTVGTWTFMQLVETTIGTWIFLQLDETTVGIFQEITAQKVCRHVHNVVWIISPHFKIDDAPSVMGSQIVDKEDFPRLSAADVLPPGKFKAARSRFRIRSPSRALTSLSCRRFPSFPAGELRSIAGRERECPALWHLGVRRLQGRLSASRLQLEQGTETGSFASHFAFRRVIWCCEQGAAAANLRGE